jgi:hypothetical protein
MDPGTLDALCRAKVTFPQLFLEPGLSATPEMAVGSCNQSLTVYRIGGSFNNPRNTFLGFSIILPYDPQLILAANKSSDLPAWSISFGGLAVFVDFYGNIIVTFNNQQASFGQVRLKQEKSGQIRFVLNFGTSLGIYSELQCALGQVPKDGLITGDFGPQQQAYLAFLDSSSPVDGLSAALMNGTLSGDLGLENAYVGFMVLADLRAVECDFQTIVPGDGAYTFGFNFVQKIIMLIIVVLCFVLLFALFFGLRMRNERS